MSFCGFRSRSLTCSQVLFHRENGRVGCISNAPKYAEKIPSVYKTVYKERLLIRSRLNRTFNRVRIVSDNELMKGQTSKGQKFHHSVYVVLLDDAVAKHPSILRINPTRDPLKPYVYVGMTITDLKITRTVTNQLGW
jgi:hypothetical protein